MFGLSFGISVSSTREIDVGQDEARENSFGPTLQAQVTANVHRSQFQMNQSHKEPAKNYWTQ
jgi:hypothetical protein